MQVFQILHDMCHWRTPFGSIAETVGKFPADVKFVEAPDYVNEQWGYREVDENGNILEGDDRFIMPTAPEGYIYDFELGCFYHESEIPRRLAEAQSNKQNENKNMLAEYLNNHPITWVDGKQYGITMEDQSEIQLNISQYQIQVQAGIENPVLEWHAIHEACVPWTLENLSALALQISAAVYPWFRKMQAYKEAIYACTDIKEVEALVFDYSDPSEVTEEEEATGETDDEATEE